MKKPGRNCTGCARSLGGPPFIFVRHRKIPYLRLLEGSFGVEVWRVDGHWIRDHLDVDFTNGAHHFTRRYVPRAEIWLDRESADSACGDEWVFWALHQRIQRALMAAGEPYLRALSVAQRIELRERRITRGLPTKMDPREVREVARKQALGRSGDRKVWLVSGRAVRDMAYVDFTLGGHGFRYRFIPRNEIWIDDAVRRMERRAILHHEAIEAAHMAAGLSYDEAHGLASRAEDRFRRKGRLRLVAGS